MGAICTEDGRGLEDEVEAEVPGLVAAQQQAAAPLTAEFLDLSVAAHDGSAAFTFELTFSEEVTGLSYKTLRDSAFSITNGRVTNASRLEPGKDQRWQITVEPAGNDDVVITLPATTDCTATGAICIGDDRPLSAPDPVTVPGPVEEDPVEEDPVEEDPVEEDPTPPPPPPPPPPPLTASFPASGVPVAHDGSTAFELQFHLSEEPHELSYVTLRGSVFTVTGGTIEGARRRVRGSNQNWVLTVAPSGVAKSPPPPFLPRRHSRGNGNPVDKPSPKATPYLQPDRRTAPMPPCWSAPPGIS